MANQVCGGTPDTMLLETSQILGYIYHKIIASSGTLQSSQRPASKLMDGHHQRALVRKRKIFFREAQCCLCCEDVMDDLQDLEDLLDEFAAEALRRKVVSEGRASSSKVHSFIPACFSGLSPSAVKFNISMGSKMSSITSQMEELSLGWKRLPEDEHKMLHGEEQTVHVCQQNLLFTGEMKIKPRYLIWC
ncbi:hypothetical protein Pint_27304 [Pistacia integerrima]|uniref:Uncharacterized protein n=1 Tax=Pistacia integerrima TaxID=434235 RepID=A0ACC0YUE9_9ROSI|nr:hypothetical protein Pint_27304 [Pistacia integerrima]